MAKMKISDRAKIFMPFDALKGFKEALKEKEKIEVPKKVLSLEQKEELNNEFMYLRKGAMANIVYYDKKEKIYLNIEGIVSKIDVTSRYLLVVKTKIMFDDILEIKINKEESFY